MSDLFPNSNREKVVDSPKIDGQGRFRTSSAYIQFSGSFVGGFNHKWRQKTVSGATVTDVLRESSVQLTVTSTIGSRAVVESYYYIPYQEGHTSLASLTGVFGPGVPGILQMYGRICDTHGMALCLNGTRWCILLRNSVSGSPVDTFLYQDPQPGELGWNIINTDFNGNFVTLNPGYGMLAIFDFLWQGYGDQRFGLSLGGVPYHFHEESNSNIRSVPYMDNGNLPVRYEIKNVSSTTSGTYMKATCAAVSSEGGNKIFGTQNAVFGPAAGVVLTTTNWKTILGIRPALQFNGQTNRRLTVPLPVQILLSGTNDTARFRVVHNPTVTGSPVWANVTIPGVNDLFPSSTEFTTTTLTDGLSHFHTHSAGYATSGAKSDITITTIDSDIYLTLDIDGLVQDTYWLEMQAITGTPTAYAIMPIEEV